MIADKTLEVRKTQRYQHRVGTNRKPIEYTAIVGNKRRNIGDDMLPCNGPPILAPVFVQHCGAFDDG